MSRSPNQASVSSDSSLYASQIKAANFVALSIFLDTARQDIAMALHQIQSGEVQASPQLQSAASQFVEFFSTHVGQNIFHALQQQVKK